MFLECSGMFDLKMEYIREYANLLTICHTQPTCYSEATNGFVIAMASVISDDYTLFPSDANYLFIPAEKLILKDVELVADKTGLAKYFALCINSTDPNTGDPIKEIICTGDFPAETFTIGETYIRDVVAMENESPNAIIIDSCVSTTNTSFGHLQSVNDGLGQSFGCDKNCYLDSCSFVLRRNSSTIVSEAYVRASLYLSVQTTYQQRVKLLDGTYDIVDVIYEIPGAAPVAISEPVDIKGINYYPDYWEPTVLKFSGVNRLELTPGLRYVITIQGEGPGYGYTGFRDFVYAKYYTKKTGAKGNLCQRDPVKHIWSSSGWFNPFTDQDDIDRMETWYGNSDLLFAVYGSVLLNQVVLSRTMHLAVTP